MKTCTVEQNTSNGMYHAEIKEDGEFLRAINCKKPIEYLNFAAGNQIEYDNLILIKKKA
jgi:hypothetical protein